MIAELLLTARNIVSKAYQASGRNLAPQFLQIELCGGVHQKIKFLISWRLFNARATTAE